MRNDGCFEAASQAAEMMQAMKSIRVVADRRQVAPRAPSARRVTPWLASSATSTGRQSVRSSARTRPGSPELSEATQDLLREEAVDLTQRIDQPDAVLAFDEVEWVRGIRPDEDSDRTSSTSECQHVSVGDGRGLRLTICRSVTDLIFFWQSSRSDQSTRHRPHTPQPNSELSALIDLDVELSCFHGTRTSWFTYRQLP